MAHKVRLVATAVAVLLGVAFMAGTQVLTSSVSASFDKVFADVYAPIDVVVRSSTEVDTPFGSQRSRIDASLVPVIAGVEGVTAAEGQVVAQIRVLDRDGKPLVSSQGPPNFGLNWLSSPQLNGWHLVEGDPPTSSSQIVLDAKTAADGGYAVGDTVAVSVTEGVRPFTVVGVARFGKLDTWGGAQAALFDTATAQDIVGQPGTFDWISAAGDGVSQATLQQRVEAAIPPGTEAITGAEFTKESQDAFQKIIAIFNTFLLVFALIALFVGSFIIYNTFSVIVAQRTRELALLRALGARRRQVVGSVLLEAGVVGFVASVVGVVAGIGLAMGLNALLRSIGFAGPETPLVVPASAVISSLAVGTLITLAAAVLPARRAATIAPVAAMRDLGIESVATSVRRAVGGIVVLLIGGSLVYNGLFGGDGGSLQMLGVGALLALVAMIVLGPVIGLGGGALLALVAMIVLGPVIGPPLAATLGAPLPRLLGVDGRMARENTLRNPKRTASTASAVMVGVALVGFIAVTAQSVKASTSAAIDASVQGQYVISSDGFGPTALPASVGEEVRALPEVKAAAGLRGTFAAIDGSNRLVLASDPAQLVQLIEITDVAGSITGLDLNGVAVTEKSAVANGLSLGQPITATFLQGGTRQLTIEAIYDTRFPIRGPGWLITQELFDASVPPSLQTDSAVYVSLLDDSPAGIAAARPALQAIADSVPGAELQDVGEYQRAQTSQADQFLLVVYVLLALAVVIAIVGVVNTLLLSVTERTRELGLLRAVGMTRRQVRSSIRWESLIIAFVGTITGLALGLAFGWALVYSLRDDGITTFAVPWRQLVVIIELTVLAGIGAATYPAWRASRLDVLSAIATE
jgi:putative ABC transport system permease protein